MRCFARAGGGLEDVRSADGQRSAREERKAVAVWKRNGASDEMTRRDRRDRLWLGQLWCANLLGQAASSSLQAVWFGRSVPSETAKVSPTTYHIPRQRVARPMAAPDCGTAGCATQRKLTYRTEGANYTRRT